MIPLLERAPANLDGVEKTAALYRVLLAALGMVLAFLTKIPKVFFRLLLVYVH